MIVAGLPIVWADASAAAHLRCPHFARCYSGSGRTLLLVESFSSSGLSSQLRHVVCTQFALEDSVLRCRRQHYSLETPDGVATFADRWRPEKPAKAVVQIAHGWAEHAGRYARVA